MSDTQFTNFAYKFYFNEVVPREKKFGIKIHPYIVSLLCQQEFVKNIDRKQNRSRLDRIFNIFKENDLDYRNELV